MSAAWFVALACIAGEPAQGDAVLQARAGSGMLVVTTTARLAGAIHSLKWKDKEFIDSADHGRQLQSAASFDCGSPKDFWAECFNPTEAGSRRDGAGPRSTSKILSFRSAGNLLEASNQMAFWLAPGEESAGKPARNTTVLSEHRIAKKVRLGYKNWEQAIDYQVSFRVPGGEKHTLAQFEALTGYMPAEFESFWTVDLESGEAMPIDEGPGEQARPLVFSTRDGTFAMGIFSPDQPAPGYEKLGYGRWRFRRERVVKWNCVFRLSNTRGIPAGEYRFQLFVFVGSLDEVRRTMRDVARGGR